MSSLPDRPHLVQVRRALEALKARDRDAASAQLSRLIAENPPLGSTWGSLSRMALGLGELSLAIVAAERLASLDRHALPARLEHGALLAQHGRGVAARDLARTIVADHPSQPSAWHFLGACEAAVGQGDAALDAFRQAITRSPDRFAAAPSWLALAESRDFVRDDDPELNAMNALLAQWPTTPDPQEGKAALLYALGKANDDLGHHDAAFDAYARGAAEIARLRPYDQAGTEALADTIVGGFTSEFLARLPAGLDSDRAIFVLGLPRSGTTLVEQILVSHSQVSDGAELNLFRAASMPVGGVSSQALAAFVAHRPQGLVEVGHAYLRMLEDRFGPDGRVVDKTLNHSRYLGLIHSTLPRARFVWLRRDPGAVAWSVFRTWFAQGVSWSWSLERIAHYMRIEDRLYAHWRAVLGDAILTVPYEALVAEPGPWIDRILAHVGLPHEPGLEDFHKTERVVTTASFAQVRQPLYTGSTDAWRPYERKLQPFFDAYANR